MEVADMVAAVTVATEEDAVVAEDTEGAAAEEEVDTEMEGQYFLYLSLLKTVRANKSSIQISFVLF